MLLDYYRQLHYLEVVRFQKKAEEEPSRPSFSLIHCLCSGRVLLVIFFAALAAVMLPFVILAPLGHIALTL